MSHPRPIEPFNFQENTNWGNGPIKDQWRMVAEASVRVGQRQLLQMNTEANVGVVKRPMWDGDRGQCWRGTIPQQQ
jgi:hypothetical protein